MAQVVLKINIDLPGLTKDLDKVITEIKGKLGTVGKVEIEAETSDAIKDVDKLKNAVENTEEAAKKTGASFTDWATIFTGLNQGLQLLSEVVDVISKPIEDAAQFEQYEASLTVMLGSAEKAKQRLEELTEFAANTPFELPQVVEAANQLQAVGKYSEETLTILGDLASASGKSFDQVLSAYSKMASGQKGIAIDMFRDLLITTDDWVKATGKQIGKNGELQASVEDMAKALPQIIEAKGFAGMMKVQSETMNGMKSNFEDSLGKFSTYIGKQLMPAIKILTASATNMVNTFIPAKTEVEKLTESAAIQKAELQALSNRYLQLKDSSKLTSEQQAVFDETIKTLHAKYPNYIKDVDLYRGSYEDVKKALYDAAISLDEYNNAMIRNAVLEAKKKEIIELTAKIMVAEKVRLDNTSKSWTDAIDNQIKYGDEYSNQIQRVKDSHKDFASTSIEIIKEQRTKLETEVAGLTEYLDNILGKVTAPNNDDPIVNANAKRGASYKKFGEVAVKSLEEVWETKEKENLKETYLNKLYDTSETMRSKKISDESKKRMALITGEAKAKYDLTKQAILNGIEQYDAEKSLGANLANITRQNIKRILAEAVAEEIAKVITTLPWPLNLIVGPLAGAAVSALFESIVPKFESGGLVNGNKHRDGGKTINVEGGEYIFDAETVGKEPQNFEKLHRMLKAGEITIYDLLNPVAAKIGGLDPNIISKLSTLDIVNRTVAKDGLGTEKTVNLLNEMINKFEEIKDQEFKFSLNPFILEEKTDGRTLLRVIKFAEKDEAKR